MPNLMSGAPPTSGMLEMVYVVQRRSSFENDGFHPPVTEEHVSDSAYLSEDQAYAMAIRRQIAYMERVTGDAITELRSIVTEKGTSVKGRFQKMQKWIEEKDWFADTEVVEYHVQACPLGFEKVDTDDLLEGLDEPGYSAEDCTEDSDDEEFEDESRSVSKPCPVLFASSGKKRRRESD